MFRQSEKRGAQKENVDDLVKEDGEYGDRLQDEKKYFRVV